MIPGIEERILDRAWRSFIEGHDLADLFIEAIEKQGTPGGRCGETDP